MAYNSTDNTVDIYYVDYGDSCWVEFTNQNLQLLRYVCLSVLTSCHNVDYSIILRVRQIWDRVESL